MALRQTITLGVMPGAFAFTSNVAADDTVVIGDITYTFKADPTGNPYEVDVGSDLDDSIGNLVAAINASGTDDDEYGAGTVANPYVSAAADLANDEIDLTARFGGAWVNGLHLAATSPGGNDIAVEAAAFGLGANTGHADGAGSVATFLSDLQTYMQINSEVEAYVAGFTAAAD